MRSLLYQELDVNIQPKSVSLSSGGNYFARNNNALGERQGENTKVKGNHRTTDDR